ncbi:MAG: hypothetical protein AAB787_03430 [Patescibacteria group bacterium]
MSVFALVHIGSASVSGALVDGKKVIFASEQACRFQQKLDSGMFLEDVALALKQVLEDLLKARLGSPSKVVIFLSAPFVAGQLNILRQNNTKPLKVTEKVIADLVLQDTAKFREDKKHIVVDSKIMGFRINGYATAEPHGQSASELEISHYLSISAEAVLAKFRNVIKSACHHDQVEFHSASFTLFSVVRGLQPADESLLLLDIGGEITELTLVWQGIIRETFSFPLGHNALVRHLMASKEATHSVAHASLDLDLVDEKNLAKVQTEWLKNFQEGLVKVVQHRFWSGEITLLVENSARSSVFTTWLNGASLDKLFFSAKKIEVKSLTPELLQPLVVLDPRAKPSLPLLVESIFMLK